MIVRSIDGSNDWLFGNGKGSYKKDKAAVAQNIKTRLQSFLGNCFFASNAGLDWFNLLGTKNILKLRLVISSTILNTEDVTAILEVSSVLSDSRVLTIEYSANTAYGTLNNQTVVII